LLPNAFERAPRALLPPVVDQLGVIKPQRRVDLLGYFKGAAVLMQKSTSSARLRRGLVVARACKVAGLTV